MPKNELAFVIFHLQKKKLAWVICLGDLSYTKRLAWVICHTQKDQVLFWCMTNHPVVFFVYDKTPRQVLFFMND
jgi:hypothetical protein